MASSLVIGRFDLLDPTSEIVLATGFARGEGVPSVSEIVSTVLDGAVVTGRAASNRSMEIPVIVRSGITTRIPRTPLQSQLATAALANELLQIVNSTTWMLTFTPNGGMPVIYDCYRATVEVTSDLVGDAYGFQGFTIRCEALPYGRSPNTQEIDLTGTLRVIESFETLPTVTTGPDTRQQATVAPSEVTFPVYSGTKSLAIQIPLMGFVGNVMQFRASRTGMSVLAGSADLTTFLIQAQNTYTDGPLVWYGTQWQLQIVADGITYTSTSSDTLHYERWNPLTFQFEPPIPSGATIASWQLTSPIMSFREGDSVYLDYMRAFATSAEMVSSPNGSYLTLPFVYGSARTPVAVELSRVDSTTFDAWCVHVPPPDRTSAQPLIPLGDASAPSVSYTTSPNARYGGTYSVWLAITVTTNTSTLDVPITFSQSAPSGGPTATVHASVPGAPDDYLIYAGEVALPLVGYPPEASVATTVTVAPGSAGSLTVVHDVLLLDTRGQTVVVDATAPLATTAWVDAPAPSQAFGGVYSGPDRFNAMSVSGSLIAASTLLFEPGASNILLYCPKGALAAALTYSPRWLQEATA